MAEDEAPTPWAELAETVEALHAEVKGLRGDLVPRAELRRRWKQAALIVAVSAVLTLTAENTALSGCFLAQPKPSSAVRSACGVVFPGYVPAMRQGDQQRVQFRGLLAQIPANRQVNVDQDARLARLEAEVAKLKGRP